MTLEETLVTKIKVLNESIWESHALWPNVEEWLSNFSDPLAGTLEEQRMHALFLLSQFMYFGRREMRELLRSLYRDKFRYPVVEKIRRENTDTLDFPLIERLFKSQLKETRFLGIGNPSESGTHLLYYFRQENGLPKELFINSHEIFTRDRSTGKLGIRNPDVTRYVFIDDFCGSGTQAVTYSQDQLADLKGLSPTAEVAYYVLFATAKGIENIRANTHFDRVEAVFELDETYKCFAPDSRYFSIAPSPLKKGIAEAMSLYYGSKIYPRHPLGYKDGQLLLGFYHNTPDNTLPIIWNAGEVSPWSPIFRRYPKLYTWSSK